MRPVVIVMGLVVLVLLAGCRSGPRGDPDGQPAAFDVTLTRDYADNLARTQARVGAGVGMGFVSGGRRSTGVGVGIGFAATSASLRGGSNPGGSDVFRHSLHWGEQRFEIPLRPGRELHLTVVFSGGRTGTAQIGSLTVDPSETIRIVLDGTGHRVTTAR